MQTVLREMQNLTPWRSSTYYTYLHWKKNLRQTFPQAQKTSLCCTLFAAPYSLIPHLQSKLLIQRSPIQNTSSRKQNLKNQSYQIQTVHRKTQLRDWHHRLTILRLIHQLKRERRPHLHQSSDNTLCTPSATTNAIATSTKETSHFCINNSKVLY